MKRLINWFRENEVIEVAEANFTTGRIYFRKPKWKLKPTFKFCGIWVGVYIDHQERRVYFFPIPFFGFVFYWD